MKKIKSVISKKIIILSQIILSIMVLSIGVFAGESKAQVLNKQIAVLESKVFALKTENKKLKKELEKKNKAITSLAMRLSSQPVKTASRTAAAKSRHSNSSAYNPAQAAKLAAKQRKQERTRQLAIINKKISYYEKQKPKLENAYKLATKKLRSAKYILGKSQRETAIQEASDEQGTIKYKIKRIESNIDNLRKQSFNYQ